MDRKASRRCSDSLDAIFAVEIEPKHILDSVEPKLFGIGSRPTSSVRTSSTWATPCGTIS